MATLATDTADYWELRDRGEECALVDEVRAELSIQRIVPRDGSLEHRITVEQGSFASSVIAFVFSCFSGRS